MRNLHCIVGGVVVALSLSAAPRSLADDIARFDDPLPGGGGETMFLLGLSGFRLYGGWSGPPRIDLESPLGVFPDCTMWLPPMRVELDGRVTGGQIVFFMHNQTEVLRIGFTNGRVDASGFGCGPQTGGSVQFVYSAGGVQLPPALHEPLQQPWFHFEFHNAQPSGQGPTYTASFRCGARGRTGDLNCDGAVDNGDIDAFVLALLDPAAYAASERFCEIYNGDVNRDGAVDNGDIDGFVQCLLSGACP